MKRKLPTRAEQLAALPIKRHVGSYGTKQDVKQSVSFSWDLNPNYLHVIQDDFDSTKAPTWLEKLNLVFRYFSEVTGVPEKKIQVYFSATASYYDSYDMELNLSGVRPETDEEFEKRIAEMLDFKKKLEKVKAEEAVNKVKREKEQLRRLLKKYGSE